MKEKLSVEKMTDEQLTKESAEIAAVLPDNSGKTPISQGILQRYEAIMVEQQNRREAARKAAEANNPLKKKVAAPTPQPQKKSQPTTKPQPPVAAGNGKVESPYRSGSALDLGWKLMHGGFHTVEELKAAVKDEAKHPDFVVKVLFKDRTGFEAAANWKMVASKSDKNRFKLVMASEQ